jgi:hypothetical protein
MFWFTFLAFSSTIAQYVPEAGALNSVISSVCSQYSDATLIGKHVHTVFPSGTVLPPLSSYSAQTAGLINALKSYSFGSKDEFVAFLANILWESICLSQKEELCRDSCIGGRFHGRGYIQITGEANYRAFANDIGRPDILDNPGIVASDEVLAWASAFWFWKNNVAGSQNVGSALLKVNSLECTSSSSQSSIYYQFAPFYRLKFAEEIANGLGASSNSDAAKNVCQQMNYEESKVWEDFCSYHGKDKSVNCQNSQKSDKPSPGIVEPTIPGFIDSPFPEVPSQTQSIDPPRATTSHSSGVFGSGPRTIVGSQPKSTLSVSASTSRTTTLTETAVASIPKSSTPVMEFLAFKLLLAFFVF